MASKSAARVIVKDKGFAALIAIAKRLGQRPRVKVGFLAETNDRGATVKKARVVKGQVKSRGGSIGNDDELSNAELAIILHYGSRSGVVGRIPPRPFMRVTAQRERSGWRRLLLRVARAVLRRKMTLQQAFEQVGERAERDIKRTMRDGLVPDAPATVEEKGSSHPLIDSKRLIEAVTHKVMAR